MKIADFQSSGIHTAHIECEMKIGKGTRGTHTHETVTMRSFWNFSQWFAPYVKSQISSKPIYKFAVFNGVTLRYTWGSFIAFDFNMRSSMRTFASLTMAKKKLLLSLLSRCNHNNNHGNFAHCRRQLVKIMTTKMRKIEKQTKHQFESMLHIERTKYFSFSVSFLKLRSYLMGHEGKLTKLQFNRLC